MRLLCNGVALDLEAGATMSFKKLNPLFAFDKLTCERTQSFNLPATPTNDLVLELAKIPAYYGAGMRRRFDAELQDGTVVKQGYLYVDKYASGKYSAVFVTGELFGLLKIKQAGKLAELAPFENTAIWNAQNEFLANSAYARDTEFYTILYKSAYNGVSFPSVLARSVAMRCAQALDVTIASWPANTEFLRLVPPELKPFESIPITIRSEQYAEEEFQDDVAVNIPHSTNSAIVQPSRMAFMYPLYQFVIEPPYADSWWQSMQDPGNRHTLAAWRAMEDIDIKLPDNLPDNMFMVETIPPVYSRTWENWRPAVFYGDYWFDQSGHPSGTPLRGRTVRVEKGKQFAFISNEDWRLLDADRTKYHDGQLVEASYWEHNGVGYLDAGQPGYEYRLEVSQASEIADGSKVYEIGTLPDITLIDLFKAVATMSGTVLNYTDAEGLTFDVIDTETWPTIELEKVTKLGDITRKFSDYAKRNIVKFASSSGVFSGERLTTEYVIDNDNLEAEKVLQELPFSECGLAFDNDGKPVAYIRGNEDGGKTDKWSGMLANQDGGSRYMSRVSLSKNASLQSLCDASTSVTVSARMTLQEYEALAAKVTILYAGTRYVWTEAQYSKGVVTLKLSKIPA